MDKKTDFQKLSVYDAPKKSPGFLLWHISTTWRSSIENVLKNCGLTHPQFVVLASLGWLTRNGAVVNQKDVGKLAGLDPNTCSQIVKGLERKELIIRESSNDGRAKNPKLTAKGDLTLSKALPAVEKADGLFFEPLTQNELSSLITIFQKLHTP